MSQRVTNKDLELAFEAYTDLMRSQGIEREGHSPQLFHGSKISGRAYRLFWVDASGGQRIYPGTGHNGYLGETKQEAYDYLWNAHRVLSDFLYFKRNGEI